MRAVLGLVAAAGLAVSATAVADQQPVDGDTASKLHGGLAATIQAAQPGEMIPVVIVLEAQTPQAKIDAAANIRDKEVRRAAVTDLLKDTAETTQGDVLAMLEDGRAAGQVGERITSLWIANAVAADVTAEMALQLAARDDVWYVHEEQRIGDEVFPVEREIQEAAARAGGGDVLAAIECGVDLMGAPEVWGMGYTGQDTVVCVIDTGICTTHPDLANQIWVNPGEVPGNGVDDDNNGFVDDINGWNFENNNANVTDFNGHGTHVSGTVGGDGTNGEQTGMAPDTQIMMSKFWNNFSGEASVWNGMQYAVDNGADVVTASLGWPHSFNPDRPMWRMVSENTFDAGVVTLFAAGNEGNCCGVDSVRTPGDVPDMITVGATDCNDAIAGFSSRGPVTWENVPPYFDWPLPEGKLKPTISAPGVNTLSTSNNCTGYFTLSGTSMATPHVAGAVALILSANPDLDHYEVKQLLKDTSIDLGAAGEDNTFGHGRVDALAAVEAALDMSGCPADFNGDGNLDVNDFIDFQNAWQAGDANADFNGDGDFTILDFIAFSDAFQAGCP